MPKNWHALYIKSRSEKKVLEAFAEKNIEAYTPIVKTMRQWSDRKKMVEMPLLNGYVFINIEPKQQEEAVKTKGVVNYVRSDGKIAILRELEINRLKQLVQLGYHLEALPITKEYKEGDKVKISSGALKGLEGYVVEGGQKREIEIVLESIGQCIRVKLPKELLIEVEGN